MFTHVVLFELKAGSDASEIAARLRSLPPKIPTLREAEVGVDILRGDRAMDVCLITRFDDQQGYEAYRDHPDHLALLGWLRPQLTRSLVADWASESA